MAASKKSVTERIRDKARELRDRTFEAREAAAESVRDFGRRLASEETDEYFFMPDEFHERTAEEDWQALKEESQGLKKHYLEHASEYPEHTMKHGGGPGDVHVVTPADWERMQEAERELKEMRAAEKLRREGPPPLPPPPPPPPEPPREEEWRGLSEEEFQRGW